MFRISFILVLVLAACKPVMEVQQKALYDNAFTVEDTALGDFKASAIFKDDYDKSVWVSPEVQCVQMASEKVVFKEGNASLKVNWDKIKGNCKWIGVGFGWNNWMAKDMSDIADEAAVSLSVKAVSGNFKNLPVAFAFEDYSGVQCYYGFRQEMAPAGFNDSTWTSVVIPLEKFNFKARDFDTEKVKQFIIQLEGDGAVYIDDIKIISFPRKND
jgi:hypothetical protein